MTRAEAAVKRGIDVVVAAFGLAILAPLFGVITILIALESTGPVLFASERLGKRGKRFKTLKFRSMYHKSSPRYLADGSMLVEQSDRRITRIGKVLRLGFDELPQLWNVLRGEMSLIGPRPDLPHALELYRGEEVCRLSVRPGITGLAQVKGRTSIPWRERLAYDVEYVKKYSVGLDLKIAFLTLGELSGSLWRLRGR